MAAYVKNDPLETKENSNPNNTMDAEIKYADIKNEPDFIEPDIDHLDFKYSCPKQHDALDVGYTIRIRGDYATVDFENEPDVKIKDEPSYLADDNTTEKDFSIQLKIEPPNENEDASIIGCKPEPFNEWSPDAATVKKELDIEATVLQPPDIYYTMRQCKSEPAYTDKGVGRQTLIARKETPVPLVQRVAPLLLLPTHESGELNCMSGGRAVEPQSTKMLIFLQSGEQRLITFMLHKASCTLQEVLEQVNVPFSDDTCIQCVQSTNSEIEYFVSVGSTTPIEEKLKNHPVNVPFSDDTCIQCVQSTNSEIEYFVSVGSPTPIATIPVIVRRGLHSPPRHHRSSSTACYLALCKFCGYTGGYFYNCQRCRRTFQETPKGVLIPPKKQQKKTEPEKGGGRLTLMARKETPVQRVAPLLPTHESGEQNCMSGGRAVEPQSAKMLIFLQSGEQRLITFALPKTSCTLQEVLEQVNVPFSDDTCIQCMQNTNSEIDYFVSVGSTTPIEETLKNPPMLQGVHPGGTSLPRVVMQRCSEMSTPKKTRWEQTVRRGLRSHPRRHLALCKYCGFAGRDFENCQRCKRKFPQKPKGVLIPPPPKKGQQKKKEPKKGVGRQTLMARKETPVPLVQRVAPLLPTHDATRAMREAEAAGGVPAGLPALLEGLSREVLKANPTDIYAFSAQHFEKLLKIRDNREGKSGDPSCMGGGRAVEPQSAKMLIFLQSGEQRLITFMLPKASCTLQEVLEQVNVPFSDDTCIQCMQNTNSEIDYFVSVGSTTPIEDKLKNHPMLQGVQPGGMSLPRVVTQHRSKMSTPKKMRWEQTVRRGLRSRPRRHLALCKYCGFAGRDFDNCQRCKRKFPEKPKGVVMPPKKEHQKKKKPKN